MRAYVLLCSVCFVGCAQTSQPGTQISTPLQAVSSVNPAIPSAAIESELRAFATSWQGTPHVEGGSSRSGIDAPGLVVAVADQILGLSFPHSTARQLGFGKEVERASLMPGDIVFFRPTSMPRHVGIYLGSQEFLHAWPEDGVSIGRMDEPYWSGAYWAGRRVLVGQDSVQIPMTPEEPLDSLGNRRVGW
ncbi:MAG: hypothetical protein F4069_09075 [Rhodothermaceae bacterium]|nr:hypothetical protein [Rhodothermaceae bacterium]MXW33453.1 hypothetical protein [Rhodothermaceae bacterium]MXZ17631.1 hypothetical protein [Rhodothermaceae bacterium]MYC04807.1 hypothetical protein [Rhodothermaceae bacterium]MYE63939.1 hypothetical protein [Rhodothermaceae bacterium]